MIKVLFFASLRDQLGISELQLPCEANPDTNSLLDNLKAQDQHWSKALKQKQLMVAVNQTIATSNCLLQDGDEVAFFPPVTGG
ncbi:molybdopterin converting factor subunit 1 [Psychromonas antarctica]|uniref:molybdopterin converting factor subunit 1 n=1 Tax=Psychromonas antarctica TaxID=67573 RepID=UPI001EE7BABF|nr:molybdopterin converting factor subunit 1 [Psychromonas antarctica]MCG6199925.1 molybdopterin converting factor subunit 1 [Psychromonas antarctica]